MAYYFTLAGVYQAIEFAQAQFENCLFQKFPIVKSPKWAFCNSSENPIVSRQPPDYIAGGQQKPDPQAMPQHLQSGFIGD